VIEIEQCFGGNRVAGAEVLLDLDRKRLLAEARTLLPLWYSLPIVSWLVALFSKGSRRNKRQRTRDKTATLAGQAKLADPGCPMPDPWSLGRPPRRRTEDAAAGILAGRISELPGFTLEYPDRSGCQKQPDGRHQTRWSGIFCAPRSALCGHRALRLTESK